MQNTNLSLQIKGRWPLGGAEKAQREEATLSSLREEQSRNGPGLGESLRKLKGSSQH